MIFAKGSVASFEPVNFSTGVCTLIIPWFVQRFSEFLHCQTANILKKKLEGGANDEYTIKIHLGVWLNKRPHM